MVHVNKPLVLGALSAVAVAVLVFALVRSDKSSVRCTRDLCGYQRPERPLPPCLQLFRWWGEEKREATRWNVS